MVFEVGMRGRYGALRGAIVNTGMFWPLDHSRRKLLSFKKSIMSGARWPHITFMMLRLTVWSGLLLGSSCTVPPVMGKSPFWNLSSPNSGNPQSFKLVTLPLLPSPCSPCPWERLSASRCVRMCILDLLP